MLLFGFGTPTHFIEEPLAPTRRGPVQGIVLLWGKSDNAAPLSTKNCIPVDLSWSCMKFTVETVCEVAMALTGMGAGLVVRQAAPLLAARPAANQFP